MKPLTKVCDRCDREYTGAEYKLRWVDYFGEPRIGWCCFDCVTEVEGDDDPY